MLRTIKTTLSRLDAWFDRNDLEDKQYKREIKIICWCLRLLDFILYVAIEIAALGVVYWIACLIGNNLFEDAFQSDLLFSLFILPALYLLKDAPSMINDLWVRAGLSDKELFVRIGIFKICKDQLECKNIENIEVYRSLLGSWLNYGTITVYTYGSSITIPYVKDPFKQVKLIEKIKSKHTKDIK
jgi:hypothetical protein